MYIPRKSKFDPDESGHFGLFGGRFVPETLMPLLIELQEAYESIRFDESFWRRPIIISKSMSADRRLTYAENLSNELGGKIYLKRESKPHRKPQNQ